MFESIVGSKYVYEQRLRSARIQLDKDRLNNEKITQYREEYESLVQLCDRVNKYVHDLKLVQTAVEKESHEYQTRQIDYLNDIISDSISKIFPDKHVRAELKSDFQRTDKVSLLLYDEYGNDLIPHVCEGQLMQYLISVSAVAAITKSLGVSGIFVDEAFGVARVEHLDDLGDMLQSFVNNGLQVVIISQNPALYNSLERHEIHLETVDAVYETYAEVVMEKDL